MIEITYYVFAISLYGLIRDKHDTVVHEINMSPISIILPPQLKRGLFPSGYESFSTLRFSIVYLYRLLDLVTSTDDSMPHD